MGCTKCGESNKKFGTREGGKKRRQCTDCTNLAKKVWYHKNPEKHKRSYDMVCQRTQDWINEFKMECGCVECGFVEHPAALAFHHVRKKTMKIDRNKPLYKVKAEASKCIVLCHNCHSMLHYKELR